jgi:TolB protein
MRKTVFSILSILSTVAFLLFAGCTEDLPNSGDLSSGSRLKSAIVGSPTGNNGSKVVFSSNREGWPPELFTMNIDGTNLTRLTNGGYGTYGFKDISPDGLKVVFGCNKNNNIDIYIVNIDGSGFQRLTDFAGPDANPRFTPNGQKIVFRSNRGGPSDFYTMNLDGSGVEQLTNLGWGWNHSPCISRNGRELLFVRAFMRTGDIYKMDLIDGTTVRLTFDGFQKLLPSWSPDGKKIVFAARVGPVTPPPPLPPTSWPPYDIFVMDADGSNIENLTEYPGEDRHPCWSPDGRHIIFHRKDPGVPPHLWVMKADGSDPVQITEDFGNTFPAWGPGRIE